MAYNDLEPSNGGLWELFDSNVQGPGMDSVCPSSFTARACLLTLTTVLTSATTTCSAVRLDGTLSLPASPRFALPVCDCALMTVVDCS